LNAYKKSAKNYSELIYTTLNTNRNTIIPTWRKNIDYLTSAPAHATVSALRLCRHVTCQWSIHVEYNIRLLQS